MMNPTAPLTSTKNEKAGIFPVLHDLEHARIFTFRCTSMLLALHGPEQTCSPFS